MLLYLYFTTVLLSIVKLLSVIARKYIELDIFRARLGLYIIILKILILQRTFLTFFKEKHNFYYYYNTLQYLFITDQYLSNTKNIINSELYLF